MQPTNHPSSQLINKCIDMIEIFFSNVFFITNSVHITQSIFLLNYEIYLNKLKMLCNKKKHLHGIVVQYQHDQWCDFCYQGCEICFKTLSSGYCFSRFLHDHRNIAIEGNPKPGLCPTLISNDFKGSL